MKSKSVGAISFSRPTFSDGSKKIVIQIEDELSNVRLLEVTMDLEKFAEAVTGLHGVKCEMEGYRLDLFGKKSETIHIEAPMPKCEWSERKEVARKACESVAESGWEVSSYFGSQGSFFHREGVDYCKTTAYRYTDATEEDYQERLKSKY